MRRCNVHLDAVVWAEAASIAAASHRQAADRAYVIAVICATLATAVLLIEAVSGD